MYLCLQFPKSKILYHWSRHDSAEQLSQDISLGLRHQESGWSCEYLQASRNHDRQRFPRHDRRESSPSRYRSSHQTQSRDTKRC